MKRMRALSFSTLILTLFALYCLAPTTTTPLQAATTAPTKTKTPTAIPTPVLPKIPLFIGVNNGKSLYDGDVWAWSNSQLLKRTNNGHNFVPIVSPTSDWLAFNQVPAAFVKIHPDHDNVTPPTDIYLFNIKTGKATAITTQPDTIIEDFNNFKTRYTIRSQPAWAPDGKSLAWTEIVIDQIANLNSELKIEQLVVYDLASNKTHVLIDKLPPHRFAGPSPILSQLSWGPNNLLAVLIHSSEDVDPNDTDALFVYDRRGTLVSQVDMLTATDPGYDITQMIWLTDLSVPYLSCISCVTRVDTSNGTVYPLFGSPEAYSALAPDKLSLYYGTDSGDEANVTWIILLNGKKVSQFNAVRIAQLTDFAISPDGMQIAAANYAGQGSTAGVFIFRAQKPKNPPVTVLLNVTGMGWGPLTWRLHRGVADYLFF